LDWEIKPFYLIARLRFRWQLFWWRDGDLRTYNLLVSCDKKAKGCGKNKEKT